MNLFYNISIYLCIFGFAVLSGYISEKAGIINIAIEGIMLIGALTFSIVGNCLSNYQIFNNNYQYTQFLAFLIAGLVALIFSLLHAFTTILLKSDHIISSVALNIIAASISLYLIEIYKGKIDHGYTSLYIDKENKINISYIIYFLAFLITMVFLFILFHKTSWGLHHIAVGENQNAALNAGINVKLKRFYAIIISGLLAGFAGSIFAIDNGISFTGSIQGKGYIALALLILCRWNLKLIMFIVPFFAFLFVFSLNIDKFNLSWLTIFQGGNSKLFIILSFLIPLIILMIFKNQSYQPKMLGKSI